MDGMKRRESGASEVIGAVLLVALVVVGGAVVAAFMFGQPTPKEVPHVSFGVDYNATEELLTLHHTGGDSLLDEEYNVSVFDDNNNRLDVTRYVFPDDVNWSSGGAMRISNVPANMTRVVLSYRDNTGGETVLRKVAFNDSVPATVTPTIADWTISGFKLNASGGAYTGPPVTITLYQKIPGNDNWQLFGTPTQTDGSGFYLFHVLQHTETYRIVETVPDLWRAVSPASGTIDDVMLNPGHIKKENQNFTNELIPPTPTPSPTPTPTPSPTPTPTPTPATISGHKFRVYTDGTTVTGNPVIPGITIILERWTKTNNNKWEWKEVTPDGRRTTDNNGFFEFPAPTDGGTYRLREIFNAILFTPYNQTDGIIPNVLPGTTNNNFYNRPIIGDGKGTVVFLEKAVQDDGDRYDDDGGYVVNGTTLLGDAKKDNYVTINGYKHTFQGNEEYRFTIVGDQYSGELMGNDKLDLTSLTFNVRLEVRSKGETEWHDPTDMGHTPVIGRPSAINIESIDKNKIVQGSTLTYRFPQYTPTDTLLRLNGDVVIDSPADDTYLEFMDLFIVHDNRYHEGNNIMWVRLMPGYDYILVQGTPLSP